MKSAVLNDVPPETFKSMDKYPRRYVFDLMDLCWHERYGFEIWHKS